MAEILSPRPAATVLTLRESAESYEILMLRRNLNSDFVGGAHVFPGGGVDDDDLTLSDRVYGLSDVEASARLGLSEGGIGYYVAALRELFEEAGLLIARDASGQSVVVDDDRASRLENYRRRLNEGEETFVTVLNNEDLYLDAGALTYFAHWVTPVGPPRRYSTRFFVTLAPPGQRARHDDHETVAERWVRPRDALAADERGEFTLLLPTRRNLLAIADFPSARAVLAHAAALEKVECVEPRIVDRDGHRIIVTPGDEGYEDATRSPT